MAAEKINVREEIKSMKFLDAKKYSQHCYKSGYISMEAVELYNNALEKAQREGEDIAIIELKKALSSHENFIEALTLLGMCYMITKNNEEANKCLLKAADLGEYGIRSYILLHATGVLEDISPESDMNVNSIVNDVKEKNNGVNNRNVRPKENLTSSNVNKDPSEGDMLGAIMRALKNAVNKVKKWFKAITGGKKS